MKQGYWDPAVLKKAVEMKDQGFTYDQIIFRLKLPYHRNTLARRVVLARRVGIAQASERKMPSRGRGHAPKKRKRLHHVKLSVDDIENPKYNRNWHGTYDPKVDRPLGYKPEGNANIPSRRGNMLYYPDGRVEPFPRS